MTKVFIGYSNYLESTRTFVTSSIDVDTTSLAGVEMPVAFWLPYTNNELCQLRRPMCEYYACSGFLS